MKFKLFNKKLLFTTCLFTLTGSYSYYKNQNLHLTNTSNTSKIPFFINLLPSNTSLQCKDFTNDLVSSVSYPANNPIEDRFEIKNLIHMKNALFLSVLDGHGGHQLSEFANKKLSNYIDNAYNSLVNTGLDEKERVVTSIKEAFHKIEMEFKEEASKLYKNGDGKLATVGSCVLISIIHNDILYVANLGDSKARLFRYDHNNKDYYGVKLMNTHNSEKPKEKEALFKKFPNENDIVICKRPDGTVCYVKGRLQPTRSLGDFHLKYKEFNLYSESGYKKPILNFNGPYISATPEITVYELDYSKDKYLLLGTDGLFDFVRTTEIADFLTESDKSRTTPNAYDLLKMTITEAARSSRMTRDDLLKIPLGKRRNYHDDTTILLLFLGNKK